MTRLEQAADELRAVVDDIVARLGDDPHPVQDTAQDCDPQRPDRSFLWLYQVRAAARTDAENALRQHVVPDLGGTGWQVTDRDTDAMVAVQFERAGTDLGVTLARTAGGDVIVGGSTACVPAG